MKKRVLALALSICMLIIGVLSACGGKQETTGGAEANGDEPITLQVLMYGINQMSGVQDDSVTKWVQEKTGITIDVLSTTGMNLDAELNAMIASDSLPDIVVGITPEQRQLLHDTDSIIPLDDLVEEYAPEVTNKKSGRTSLEFSRKYYSRNNDGKLYFLNLRGGDDFVAGFPTLAPYIRWDVYEKIGKPEVKNMDDLLNVLKQMQDAYPETEDGKKVYAISGFLADAAWNTYSLTAAEAFFGFRKLDMYGLAGANISEPEKMINAMDGADAPTWELIRYFNKAYQMGILDPETVTMKFDQWWEKVSAGQVLYAPLGVQGAAIMNDTEKAFLPIKFDEFTNESFTCNYSYSNGQAPYAITKACKDPARAMQLLNLAWSYEGAYTFANGVEGDTWEKVDGVPVLKADYVASLDAGERQAPLFATFIGPLANEETETPINLLNSMEYFKTYRQTGLVKGYCEYYGVDAPIENYITAKYHTWDEAYDRGVAPYTGDLKEIDNRTQEYVLTNIPRLVVAENDEEFEEMRQKFMADIDELEAYKLFEFRAPQYTQLVKEVQEMVEKSK